jgi:putative aminopeptidase FrvX
MKKQWRRILFFLWLVQLGSPLMTGLVHPEDKISPEISDRTILKTIHELQAFGNRTTWEKQNDVADYLFKQLNQVQGLEVRYHYYQSGGKTWKNVVARSTGKKDPQSVYVFCAHYDSHPSGLETASVAPGADDNATGVAVLLEGARIIGANPGGKTIEWLFFSNEEQGHLGSKAYVQDLKAKGLSPAGVINIDTIGYTQSSFKAIWDDSKGKGFVSRVGHVGKQLAKKSVYFFQIGFKNPNEILLVGGRPANAALVEQVYAKLRKTEIGIKKEVGPQCG